jgi:hypothetical protein
MYMLLIIICLLSMLLLLFFIFYIKNSQKIHNTIISTTQRPDNTIISHMGKNAGFFSMLHRSLNHYLTAKKQNVNFVLKTTNWLYKSKNGWSDYFKCADIYTNSYTNLPTLNVSHSDVLDKFTINDYKYALHEYYKYNDDTQHKILEVTNLLKLDKNYDSIFIRRGDKLSNESKFLSTDKYIEILLNKNPYCHTIFLQTDDYNTYIDLQNYNETNQLNLRIITLCPKSRTGIIVNNHEKKNIADKKNTHKNIENNNYINEIYDNITSSTTVEDMDSTEIYNHVLDMLIGIDIIANSNICLLDYQSNVSRFIKLYHKNSHNVFTIEHPNQDIDYNSIGDIAYSGSFKIKQSLI